MPTEPAGFRPPLLMPSDRPPLGIDQNLAAADMVGGADDAVLLHPLDQPRGIVVADAELALEVGGRGLLALRYRLHRLAVELRLGIVLAGRLTLEHVAAVLRFLGDRLDIFGPALRLPEFGDGANLLVGDERAVDPGDLLAAGHVEHVALAEQLLGALLTEDGARIDLRGDRERDSGGQVRLDHSGD